MAIKKRLTNAWAEHLDDIDPDDLPPEVRQDFINLRKAMYERQPLPMETAPQASIRKMSTKEAASHSSLIVEMYSKLIHHQELPKVAEQTIRLVTNQDVEPDSFPERARRFN